MSTAEMTAQRVPMTEARRNDCERIIVERFRAGEYDFVGRDLLAEVDRLLAALDAARAEVARVGAELQRVYRANDVNAELYVAAVTRAERAEAALATLRAAAENRDGCAEQCVVMTPYRGCTCGHVELVAAIAATLKLHERAPNPDDA